MASTSNNQNIKAVAILWILGISILYLKLGKVGVATGYELSLYSVYPAWFWLLLLITQTLPFYLIISFMKTGSTLRGLLGGLMIGLSSITVLFLPVFRGYFLYGSGDILAHLGTIRILVDNHYLSSNNFYPYFHIVGSSLKLVLGITINGLRTILVFAFYVLYFLSLFMFFRYHKREVSYISLIIISPLVFSFFHYSIHPAIISLFLLAYLLFTLNNFETSNDRRSFVMALPLSIALIIAHPVSAIMGILIILAPLPFDLLRSKPFRKGHLMLITFASIMAIIWFFNFGFIDLVYRSLVIDTSPGGSPLQGTTSVISNLEVSNMYILKVFLFRYGHLFVYYIVLVIAVTLLLVGKVNRNRPLFDVLSQLLFGIVVGLVFLLNPLVIGTIQRNISLSTLFMALFIVLVMYESITKINYNRPIFQKGERIEKVFIVMVIFAVVFSNGISMMNVYQSPTIGKANPQLTEQGIDGPTWLYENYKEGNKIMYSHANMERISAYFGGTTVTSTNFISPIPDHFGYQDGMISRNISKYDAYINIVESDRVFPKVFPKSLRPRTHQYQDGDINSLNHDPVADKVYVNGEYRIWLI